MRFATDVVQVLLLMLVAPLVRGVVARVKARIQNRRGASVFRPYADLAKLLRKEDMVPPTASFIFRLAPMALFAVTVVAAAFIPVLRGSALLGTRGDFFILVYVLALGRFFLIPIRMNKHTSGCQYLMRIFGQPYPSDQIQFCAGGSLLGSRHVHC